MALQKTPTSPSPATPAKASAPVPPPIAKAANAQKAPMAPASSLPFWIGLAVSIGWVAAVLIIVAQSGPAHSFGGVALVDWAIGISAAVSPVAMVWMITAYLQRAADIQTIADPLRRQLTLITGESGAADARIRRFNQAIREQIELLRSAQTISQDDLEAVMDRVRQHRGDLERFENVSTQQIKDIQDVIRRSMFQLEQMMDDKFTMLRVLDGKLQQNGDGVARQVEGVAEQVARMLEEIEQTSGAVADSLERAQRDSQKLSDTSRLQGSSLTNAAEVAAETLGGLSSKIDLSVARFLERASTAREEAERLANALDAQTRALDDFSSTLPVRVSEAESVLRGVADRLYASEQMAREQAVHLSDKLSQQVDGLQSFMDRFTTRLSDIDAGLDRRSADLNNLSERIGATTTSFVSSWEKSLDDLHDRTGNSLLRFTVVNDETRRNADSVAAHLAETTGKYEDVVTRMRALSQDSSGHMKDMAEEVTRHLEQFEALSKASSVAGEEVQARAATALQNLQHVLERVLAAREATQAVGETLVKDINVAVDQNEKMIQRLHETAQLGARAIGAVTETLGRQESELAGKARAGESLITEAVQKLQLQAEAASNGLREQTTTLMGLLAEAQSQIVATDQKMQNFATQAVVPVQKAVQQIDASADMGLRTLGQYGEGLSVQVTRLQDFHARIGGMSGDMTKATAESATVLETLSTRFAAARGAQEEAVRQTITQFADLSERLQREVGALDDHAATSVSLLQQAAMKVGEQSYQMLENAQSSGTQIKDIAASLQSEAAHIQSTLRRQAEEINIDLTRAEQKFSGLGDTLRERADAAYAFLDRATTHYGEVSGRLDQVSDHAARIETQAAAIANDSGRAVQGLSLLNDKMASTHEAANANALQTLVKLEETVSAFDRRAGDLRMTAQNATDSVMQAGTIFGEQTGRLVDGSRQVDAVIRQMTQATAALTEQAAQIRNGMEQQNARLLAQLADGVAQMDVTGGKLQQVVNVAVQGADQASTRFADMTTTASQRIGATSQDLLATAERVESTLAILGANVTQQSASLSVVGEQISEQQKLLSVAADKQRTQMVDLFDRLGAAHKQASDIAEKSIAYLTQSLQEIHTQMGAVGDQSQTAVANVKMASVGFSEQAASLFQNAQGAEQQARTILSVTSALQEQARHLRETLQVESDRAGDSLGTLLSRLTVGGAELRELGVSTGTVFTTLQRALGEQTSELNGSMQQINDRQRSLTASLEQQRETINNLLNRLTLAQDETGAVAERASLRLTDGAEQITRSVEKLDSRAISALASVQAASTGFAQEASGIETSARQAEQQARAILTAAAGMHEQIHGLCNNMQNEGERATGAFNHLLTRITTGSAEVRDASAAAETTLTGMQRVLSDQTGELYTVMQRVGERQRDLNASLEQQRENIGGLLNRFTLAQDETASTAERAAERINEGAHKIANSMDLIGAQAGTTLSSVQQSIDGFAEQVAALNAHSQQAEQQARGLLSVTGGMQEQAHHLREAMQVESARAVEHLSAVVNQLETTSRLLKTEGGDAVQLIDATAQRFVASTETGADLVRKQAESLSQIADQSEARMNNAGEKMRGHLRLVGEIGDKAEAQARQLADAAEFATTRLVGLRDSFTAGEKQGSDAVETAGRHIEEVKAALQIQMQHLSSFTRDTVEQITTATQDLSTQSDALRANIASSEAALLGAADLVREETRQLPATLNRGVSDIETAGRKLKEQVTGADQALVGTADRFITVTAAARNNMVEEMQHVSHVAEEAGKIITGFNQALTEQVSIMRQSANLLSSEQSELVEKATQSVTALSEAGNRLTMLRSEAAVTAERLAHEFVQLDNRATATGTRLVQAGDNVARQVIAMTDAANQAETKLSKVGDGMREQLERIRAGLQTQIDDINRGLMQITAQLERTGSTLRSTTVGAVADVERVSQRFDQTGSAALEQIQKATDDVNRLIGSFATQFETMLGQMAQAGNGIKRHEGDFVGYLQNMLSHLSTVAERLEAARSLSGDVSQHAIQRLDEVVTAIQAQMNSMTAGAQTAAGIMRGIGQIYSDQTTSLTKGVGEAHGQVLTMNKSIDEMQERTDRMRTSLKFQGDELMQSLRQILAQLEMTGDGLSEAVDRTLQEQATASLKKIS